MKALRRPTVAAWLVNQLVRSEPDALDELLATGDALRDAQTAVLAGTGEGATLQELSATRRQQIDGLLSTAAQLANAAGRRSAPLELVDATLVAATADESAAAAVRSGRLVKELSYSGFGLSDDPADVVATPLRVVRAPARPKSRPGGKSAPPGRPATKPAAPEKDARRSAAEAAAAKALKEAQQACNDAAGAADDAQRSYESVAAQLAKSEETVARLTAELAAAKKSLGEVREQHDAARGAARSAHAEAERRRVALNKAQLKLDRLRGD